VVQALAVPDPNIRCGAYLGDKCLHQGRLANTWFSNNTPYLTLPLLHRRPPLRELCQFGVTPDEERRAADRGGQ
jgi:hypothetical protein